MPSCVKTDFPCISGFHRQILQIFLFSKICSLVIQSNIYPVTVLEGLCRCKEGSLSVSLKIGIICVGPVITWTLIREESRVLQQGYRQGDSKPKKYLMCPWQLYSVEAAGPLGGLHGQWVVMSLWQQGNGYLSPATIGYKLCKQSIRTWKQALPRGSLGTMNNLISVTKSVET